MRTDLVPIFMQNFSLIFFNFFLLNVSSLNWVKMIFFCFIVSLIFSLRSFYVTCHKEFMNLAQGIFLWFVWRCLYCINDFSSFKINFTNFTILFDIKVYSRALKSLSRTFKKVFSKLSQSFSESLWKLFYQVSHVTTWQLIVFILENILLNFHKFCSSLLRFLW